MIDLVSIEQRLDCQKPIAVQLSRIQVTLERVLECFKEEPLRLSAHELSGLSSFWNSKKAEDNNCHTIYVFQPGFEAKTSDIINYFAKNGLVAASAHHLANLLIESPAYINGVVCKAPIVALEERFANECLVCREGPSSIEFRPGHTGNTSKWPANTKFLAVSAPVRSTISEFSSSLRNLEFARY